MRLGKTNRRRWSRIAAAMLFAAGLAAPAIAAPPTVSFNRDVRPILSDNCFRCHGPDAAARQGDLRLDDPQEAVADRGGYQAIVPRDLEKSEVWRRIVSDDADQRMPPADSELTVSAEEREVLRRWIAAGAKYEPH